MAFSDDQIESSLQEFKLKSNIESYNLEYKHGSITFRFGIISEIAEYRK